MAHQRSPNCPQVTFQEAAEKGRLLYQHEHTHPASKEVVAQSIGYSGLNGRSLSMIGAMRQYGLIDGPSDGMRVTDDAVTFFELDMGPDRDVALSRMLFAPSVFAQIHSDFGDTLPSEQNLKHYLIKMGFLPKAAEDVIAVYRENIRLVENKDVRYNHDMPVQTETSNPVPAALVPSSNIQHIVPQSFADSEVATFYTLPLGKGSSAEVRLRGEITSKNLSLLRSQIELLIAALSDEVAVNIAPAGSEELSSAGESR
jgi:hypothetical protein